MKRKRHPFVTLLRLEAVRFAELQRKDLDLSKEYDVSIYTVWLLHNPVHLTKRNSAGTFASCDIQLARPPSKPIPFTAHVHHTVPPHASPDDKRIYDFLRFHGSRHCLLHFIIDRFKLCKLL